MENDREIKILAIESSCDETAAAVVVNGRDMRSNVISSQIELHTLYGGDCIKKAYRENKSGYHACIRRCTYDA